MKLKGWGNQIQALFDSKAGDEEASTGPKDRGTTPPAFSLASLRLALLPARVSPASPASHSTTLAFLQ
ncbi:hypothetical protein E2C01_042281 [Portunus trituberculatus]|uniref:Uncharacterized protein n=1 Tax=Portunus trituberculatus TaxID=210409 RepID=A0A5B7FT07_PORTR|nr:hypothetical protein [Portunus trituberculatus]